MYVCLFHFTISVTLAAASNRTTCKRAAINSKLNTHTCFDLCTKFCERDREIKRVNFL